MDNTTTVKSLVETSCLYLNHVHKEHIEFLKSKEELSETDKKEGSRLQFHIASLLDIIHKAYPMVYNLFPDNKENLDNILKLHHTYQQVKVLRKCDCDLCKDVQIKEDPKDATEKQS